MSGKPNNSNGSDDKPLKALLDKAEKLLGAGKADKAEELLEGALEKFGDESGLLAGLGVVRFERGDHDGAISFLKRSLKIDNKNADALVSLANIEANRENWSEALRLFERCIELDIEVESMEEMAKLIRAKLAQQDENQLGKASPSDIFRDPAGGYRAAFTEIDITPPLTGSGSVLLQGVAGMPREASKVETALSLQMLLLEDDRYNRLLFVTADLFGFDPMITSIVREQLAFWGIEPEGIILNASHTHYAPGTVSRVPPSLGPFDRNYAEFIVQVIVQRMGALYHDLNDCEIKAGVAEAQIGTNRKFNEDGPVFFEPDEKGFYDRHTPFIKITRKTDGKTVLMVNHGCHPTGSGDEAIISADFPYSLRRELIDSECADQVMFFQGGAGSSKQTASGSDPLCFAESPKDVAENGRIIARAVMQALDGKLMAVEGALFCRNVKVELPFESLPSVETLKAYLDQPDPLVREWASRLIEDIEKLGVLKGMMVEAQLVSLGERIRFIALPGEPVAELARALRSLCPTPENTFILGYTNGLSGYFPAENSFEREDYETRLSHFVYLLPAPLSKQSPSIILDAVKGILSEEKRRDESNGYGRYHLKRAEQRAFFVLSSGRCGTQTLTALLRGAKNARVWHHPQPDLIIEARQAYWDDIDKSEAFWKARLSLLGKTWADGLIHGETDMLMTPYSVMLSKEIPLSRFIVLVRNPWSFVRSGMRRDYYRSHAWDVGRLRPQTGHADYKRWADMDQFARICWLWNETYCRIRGFIDEIGNERVMTVKFEDLVGDELNSRRIYEFLGLSGYSPEWIRKVLSTPLNVQTTGEFPRPEEWTKMQHETLWRECGKNLKSFGYVL